MKTIEVKYSVRIPTVPIYFLLTEDGTTIPISIITEEGLQKIGEEWTKSLILKAKAKVISQT